MSKVAVAAEVAQQHGVDVSQQLDPPLSRAALLSNTLSTEEMYVHLLLQLQGATVASENVALFSVATGATLGASCRSAADSIAKLQRSLACIERKLATEAGVRTVQRWLPTDHAYRTAAHSLRLKQMCLLQGSITSGLAQLELLDRPLQSEVFLAGQDTRSILKAKKKLSKQLQCELDQWHFWDGYTCGNLPHDGDGGMEAPGVGRRTLDDLRQGNLPWNSDEVVASHGDSQFGVWYRHYKLDQELQRCVEERTILRLKALNALALFAYQGRVAKHAGELALQRSCAALGTVPSPVEAEEVQLAKGEAWLAEQWIAKYKARYDDALSKFCDCGLLNINDLTASTSV